MASAAVKKPCAKCDKGAGQVMCDGCQRYFCVKHLLEHRQELTQQMDALTLEHDQLQQSLMGESSGRQRSLHTRIDQWESRSINRIHQVADEVRSKLRKSLEDQKTNIRGSLHQVSRELQESRQTETFTEIELNKWMDRLKELREQLEKPSAMEVIDDGDKNSSTHISLIRLRVVQHMKGKDDSISTRNSYQSCLILIDHRTWSDTTEIE